MKVDNIVSVHRLNNTLQELMGMKHGDEIITRILLKLSYKILTILEVNKILLVNSNQQVVRDPITKAFTRTLKTYAVNGRLYPQIKGLLTTRFILSKISFTPVVLKYDPNSVSQTLRSQCKVDILNKLNAWRRTKCMLRCDLCWMSK